MDQPDRIPIPWSHRLKWLRIQALPLVIFAVCAVATVRLWKSQSGTARAVGEVYAVRVELVSRLDGLLTEVPYRRLQLFERVQAGDVVLRLDDQTIRATLVTLGKALDEAKGQVVKAEEQIRIDEASEQLRRLAEVRRRAIRVEQARLTMLETRTVLETDKVELQRLKEQASAIKEAFDKGAINRLEFTNAQLQRDRIAQRIASNEQVLTEAQGQLTRATDQMKEFTPEQTIQVAKLLTPLRSAIEVQEAKIRELELQVKALEIRSPIDGTVVAITCWPGQAVKAGDPIATVATEQSHYVISYIRQQQRIRPVLGAPVEIRSRSNPSEVIDGIVDRIGPQVEAVPSHQLRDPRVVEWGLPVRIALDGKQNVRPGELVDLKFRTDVEQPPANARQPDPAAPPDQPGT